MVDKSAVKQLQAQVYCYHRDNVMFKVYYAVSLGRPTNAVTIRSSTRIDQSNYNTCTLLTVSREY